MTGDMESLLSPDMPDWSQPKLTPETLRRVANSADIQIHMEGWDTSLLSRHIHNHADAWKATENLLRTTQEIMEALRTINHSAISQAKTIATEMQQVASDAYYADDGHTFDLTWVIEKTTHLLEVL